MSTVLPPSPPEIRTPYVPDMEAPLEDDQIPVLQDRTPDWFRMQPSGLVLVGLLCATFFAINLYGVFPQFKLWHTDLWGHLAYGRWIVDHKALPITEPLMPLSRGMPMIDSAWLSQVLGHLTFQSMGVYGLRLLYTGSVILALAGLSLTVYRRTENLMAGCLALAVFGGVSYQLFWVFRPQLAGLVCYVLVFTMATRRVWPRSFWFAIPFTFALWANLHGSFVMGLVTLGTLCVGRGIDLFRRTKSFTAPFADGGFRRLLIATELAAAATLLNPYGWGLHLEVLTFARNPNLASLLEWDPLTLRDYPGQAMAVVAFGLAWLYRATPRRITTSEILLLVGLGLWSMWTARIIVWWAPVAAYYAGLHAAAIGNARRPVEASHPAGIWTVVAFAMAFMTFIVTPSGIAATQGFKRSLGVPVPQPDPKVAEAIFRRAVSPVTPVLAAGYLKEHPPKGQVFNAYEYGDYLEWAVPGLPVFVTSHLHLVPTEVWEHYIDISNASGDWKRHLDFYGINCLVLEAQRQPALIRALRQETDLWEVAFEEKNHTVVFERKKPL